VKFQSIQANKNKNFTPKFDKILGCYIKGRYIHDGILALHEIIHEVKVRHQRGVFLKLDFQKAYDRLDWSFLRFALLWRGFDDRMVN
jgi:hypothetical protein